MNEAAERAALPHTQRSRFLRFSLRSLLLFVLFIGAVGLTIKNWDPWVLEHSFESAILSPQGTHVLVTLAAHDNSELTATLNEAEFDAVPVRPGETVAIDWSDGDIHPLADAA